jgi:hypothetical protein
VISAGPSLARSDVAHSRNENEEDEMANEVKIKLTEEQKAKIKESTGHDLSEMQVASLGNNPAVAPKAATRATTRAATRATTKAATRATTRKVY